MVALPLTSSSSVMPSVTVRQRQYLRRNSCLNHNKSIDI